MDVQMILPVSVAAVVLSGCAGGSGPGQTGTVRAPSSPMVADTDSPSTGGATALCGNAITPQAGAASLLPKGFPILDGWAATHAVTQGKTLAVSGAILGRPEGIVGLRDRVLKRLTDSGYTRTGADQEPGYEAEAEFAGAHPGSVQVKPLCRDHLVVTYTFEQ
jgi:hypothetical protein